MMSLLSPSIVFDKALIILIVKLHCPCNRSEYHKLLNEIFLSLLVINILLGMFELNCVKKSKFLVQCHDEKILLNAAVK